MKPPLTPQKKKAPFAFVNQATPNFSLMNTPSKTSLRFIAALVLITLTSSCVVHPDPYVRHGRARGALVGAGAGAIIGNNVKGISKGEGAVAGAILGSILGDARGRANSAYYGRPRRYYYY